LGRAGIDVNVVLAAADAAALEQLAATRDDLDLLGCWVSPARSCSEDPESHDDDLAAACADGPAEILPVPVLVPSTGSPRAHERASRLIRNHRVVRLCPSGHRYPLLDWVVSPIPELCDRNGTSLLLDFSGGLVPWSEVVPFARRFPSLPMVVFGDELALDRAAPAALDHALNLLLTVAGESASPLVATFGASRFLWAAGGGVRAPDGLPRDVTDGNARTLADGTYAGRHL
jgi:hypothetical protein